MVKRLFLLSYEADNPSVFLKWRVKLDFTSSRSPCPPPRTGMPPRCTLRSAHSHMFHIYPGSFNIFCRLTNASIDLGGKGCGCSSNRAHLIKETCCVRFRESISCYCARFDDGPSLCSVYNLTTNRVIPRASATAKASSHRWTRRSRSNRDRRRVVAVLVSK